MADAMICPKCGRVGMAKSGMGWSGHNKIQRYKCQGCGSVKTAGNVPYGTQTVPGEGGLMLADRHKQGRHQSIKRNHA